MPRPPAKPTRCPGYWLLPAALLVVAPKCLACLLAYTGFAATLGLGGPELCGATEPAVRQWLMFTAIPMAGLTVLIRSAWCRRSS